jgi:hypothetical protein
MVELQWLYCIKWMCIRYFSWLIFMLWFITEYCVCVCVRKQCCRKVSWHACVFYCNTINFVYTSLLEVEICRRNVCDKWLFINDCAIFWIKGCVILSRFSTACESLKYSGSEKVMANFRFLNIITPHTHTHTHTEYPARSETNAYNIRTGL